MIQTTLEAIESLPIFAAARRAGEAAAAACQAKAQAAGFDADAARAAVLELLREAGRPMSGEELVDRVQERGLVPHDARAFGAVFGALSRKGLIEAVGFAARRKGHGTSGARLWKATAASR